MSITGLAMRSAEVGVQGACSPRQITLTEWEPKEYLLTPAEASSLLQCPSQVLEVRAVASGQYRIKPKSIVGRLRVGELDLRILPKYPMQSLLKMLTEVLGLVRFETQNVGHATSSDIVDLLVEMFLREVEKVFAQGLKRTYLSEEEQLVAVRGRMDLRQTMQLHLRGQARAHCRYEDYTLDGPENGTLLAALHAIVASRALPLLRRDIAHQMKREFPGVRPRYPGKDVHNVLEYDRLNLHYYSALQLAELILRWMGLVHDFGVVEAEGFLLDMNKLFEEFIFKRLFRALAPKGIDVSAQQRSAFDEDSKSEIKPDLVLQSRTGRRLVADTKYKIELSIHPGDLYQMLAYCRVLRVSLGILVTVGSGMRQAYRVCDGATTIEVIPVDLGGSEDQIDEALGGLADRIQCSLQDGI